MLEEQGRVLRLAPEGVWVETIRQSACGSCAARKGCGQRLLAEVGQGERFEVLADNPRHLSLAAGDRVVLGLAERSLLGASALVYLMPLMVMVALALLLQQLGAPEPWVALGGLSGLALGFVGVRWFGRRAEAGCRLHPQVLRPAP